MPPTITKGSRIRARFLLSEPLGSFSLAGQQMKTAVLDVEVVGTVRHFRGDRPQAPTVVRLYVEPEGNVPAEVPRVRPYGCTCPGHDRLVEVNPGRVVEVL